jgi:hypothetical protein
MTPLPAADAIYPGVLDHGFTADGSDESSTAGRDTKSRAAHQSLSIFRPILAVLRLVTWANTRRTLLCYALAVSEGRKRVLWICATILAARKLAQIEKPSPALESCISDAIARAEKIMQKIDAKYPTITH